MIIKIMGLAFPIIGVWMKFRRGSLSQLRWAQHFFVVLWQELCMGWFTWSFSKAAWVCPARELNLCEWLAANVVSRFDIGFIVCPSLTYYFCKYQDLFSYSLL